MLSKTNKAGPRVLRIARFGVAAVLSLVVLPAYGTDGPRDVVESTTSQVLEVLRNDEMAREQKQTKIEEIVYAKVDFLTVSRLVLARNWKRLSANQQTQFVDEFKKHLSITYRDNVDKYKDDTVRITGDRKEARGDWAVMTKVVGGRGASDFLVNYRLRQKDGRWWIIDIIIEGVSMVSNFRSQFQDIMANDGPEHLLRLLKEKNAAHQSLASS